MKRAGRPPRFATVALLCGLACAQTTSDKRTVTIRGSIVDQCGDPVAHETVRLSKAGLSDMGVSTKTNVDGEFAFVKVPARAYDLHFEAAGFERHVESVTPSEMPDIETIIRVDRVNLILCFSSPRLRLYQAPIPDTLMPTSNEPIRATACELISAPDRFNGRLVTVRGHILIGFEDFRLDPMRVVMNNDLKKLDHYLTAQSYDVTATLTGRFDAVETVLCPDGKSRCPKNGGFGHFGLASARIVFQSVSDVLAKRPIVKP